MRRWLGYANDIKQPVPCLADGVSTLHAADAAAVDESGTAPRMPSGYMEPDNEAGGVRHRWTPSDTVTSVLTWLTDCVFKYSLAEILARGKTAEKIKEQVCIMCPAQTH